MKKLVTAIILFIYFTVSTGFIVSAHYCMNKFDSVRIGAFHDSACGLCGMETDGNCCWDDVTVVKMQVQHTISPVVYKDFSVPSVIPVHIETYFEEKISNSPLTAIAHPPPLYKQDKHILHCTFRI